VVGKLFQKERERERERELRQLLKYIPSIFVNFDFYLHLIFILLSKSKEKCFCYIELSEELLFF
jgi:hypothetical protein